MFNPPILVAQLRSDRLVIYPEFEFSFGKRGKHQSSLDNLQLRRYNGSLSDGAKKKLDRAISQWADSLQLCSRKQLGIDTVFSSKLVMVTLTLPSKQIHSDAYIKRELLNRMLITCNRRFKTKNYIWKAEFQQNDNIHFHIIFDKYIDKNEVRTLWNTILASHEYIDNFEKLHGHRNPNSTDIHVIKNLCRATYYMRKYMSKVECSRLEGGKAWGCSDNLLMLKPPIVQIDSKIRSAISHMKNSGLFRVKEMEVATVIYGDIQSIIKKYSPDTMIEWKVRLEQNWKHSHGYIEQIVVKALVEKPIVQIFRVFQECLF